jgi:hypothetical protein
MFRSPTPDDCPNRRPGSLASRNPVREDYLQCVLKDWIAPEARLISRCGHLFGKRCNRAKTMFGPHPSHPASRFRACDLQRSTGRAGAAQNTFQELLRIMRDFLGIWRRNYGLFAHANKGFRCCRASMIALGFRFQLLLSFPRMARRPRETAPKRSSAQLWTTLES